MAQRIRWAALGGDGELQRPAGNRRRIRVPVGRCKLPRVGELEGDCVGARRQPSRKGNGRGDRPVQRGFHAAESPFNVAFPPPKPPPTALPELLKTVSLISLTGATASATSTVRPMNWELLLCGSELALSDAPVAVGGVVSGTLVSWIPRSGSPYSVP